MLLDSVMILESCKVVVAPIPQPHYGSQLCTVKLGIIVRGRRAGESVVKDLSEEDETLRL